MKYTPGDGLLFKVEDKLFLSGIVLHSPHQSEKYVIALTEDRLLEKPAPDWSGESLFAQEFGMEGQSVLMVETILMDKGYVDGNPNIGLAYRVPLTGLVAHGGFVTIDDLARLKSFHDEELLLRQTPAMPMPGGMIFRKCFQTVAELIASVSPPNEFPTVKLYKKDGESIYFWQLFRHGAESYHLVENWGIIGGEVRYNEIKDLSKEQAREAYDLAVRRKKEEGYQHMEPQERMILQFFTTDEWGAVEDLNFRHAMEEHIDRYLYWSGNGAVSGGDIGSGTMNIFFEVISPAASVSTILAALEEKKIDRDFLIVHEERDGDEYRITPIYTATRK